MKEILILCSGPNAGFADRKQGDRSPLHYGSGVILNDEEFLLLLLQNGASLNAMDQDKITPIEEGLMRK